MGRRAIGSAHQSLARSARLVAWNLSGNDWGLVPVIIAQDWSDHLAHLREFARNGGNVTAEELRGLRNYYLACDAATLALGSFAALLATCSYHFIVWATNGKHGMMGFARRHPYRAAMLLSFTVLLIACAARIDFILYPDAWPARHLVPLKGVVDYDRSNIHFEVKLALSRNGDWVAVSHTQYLEGKGVSRDHLLYKLDDLPRRVGVEGFDTHFVQLVAFSCDEDRLVYQGWRRAMNICKFGCSTSRLAKIRC